MFEVFSLFRAIFQNKFVGAPHKFILTNCPRGSAVGADDHCTVGAGWGNNPRVLGISPTWGHETV